MIIDKAIEIQSFATYVIETDQYLSDMQKTKLKKYLQDEVPTNTFIILDGGMKIVKEQRNEDGCKKEGTRESDVNEHIKSDWTAGPEDERSETDLEEGCVPGLEYLLQYIQTWEDYFGMEREARIRRETESEEKRESRDPVGDLPSDFRLFRGGDVS